MNESHQTLDWIPNKQQMTAIGISKTTYDRYRTILKNLGIGKFERTGSDYQSFEILKRFRQLVAEFNSVERAIEQIHKEHSNG